MLFTGFASGVTVTAGPVYSSATQTALVIQQTQPSLSNSFLAMPAQLSVGQPLTVILSVTNSGGAAANLVGYVLGANFVKQGPNALSTLPTFGPAPVTATVAGNNGSQLFTFVFASIGSGTMSFNAFAQGFDANTNAAVSASMVNSANVIIQTPVSLSAQVQAPAFVTRTQNFTVTLQVTNNGDTLANNVAPVAVQALPSSSGAALLQSGPLPASAPQASGAAPCVTDVDTAAASGSLNLSASASGLDTNSSQTIFSTPAFSSSTVQEPLNLAVTSLVASPGLVGTGSNVTVLMTVKNNGGATAIDLTPSALVSSSPALLTGTSGPLPAFLPSLAGGASTVFTYVLIANAPSPPNVTLTGTASAFDANHAGVSNTSAFNTSNAVTIFPQGKLSVRGFTVSPAATASTGQVFTVALTVSNIGTGNVLTVTASALSQFGGGTANLVTAPQPVTGVASIAPGRRA